MYSLTCPSCEKKTRSPFIRIGAVVSCAECTTKIQIRSEHVRRQVRIKPEVGEDDLFTKAVVERAIEEEIAAPPPIADAPPPPPGTDHGPEYEEPIVEEAHPDLDAIAAAGAPSAHDPDEFTATALRAATTSRPTTRRRSTRKTGPSPMVLAGGGILAVGLIIGIIALLSGNGDPSPGTDGGTTDSTRDASTKDALATKDRSTIPPNKDGKQPRKDRATKDNKKGTKDRTNPGKKDGKNPTKDSKKKDGKTVPKPSIVKLEAEPLGAPAWQTTSMSFRPSIPASLVQLENIKRDNTDTGATFSADVSAKQLILSALVQIELINEEDRVYAAFEVPVALLTATNPRKVYLDVPAEYLGALDDVHWEVTDVARPKARMVILADTMGEVTTNDDQSEVKISAKNPDDRELIKSGFILAATDLDGRLLGQWKMNYNQSIKGNQKFKFITTITMPDAKKVTRWAVYGAGLPTNAAPVINNPNPNNTGPKRPKNPDNRDINRIRRPHRSIFDF